MLSEEAPGPDIPFEPGPYEPIEPNRRRRWMLGAIAAVTVFAMAALPVYNLVDARDRPVADNGLEICGFDYCVVQDAVVAAGYGDTMSRFANTFLSDSEAAATAAEMLAYVGESDVHFEMVDDLAARTSGQYSPDTRTIQIERPAQVWIIAHEVAHTVQPEHGADFQRALIDLVGWLEGPGI